MPISQNVTKYYLIQLFMGINFSEAILVLFLQSNNLSFLQIMLTQTWFTLIVMLSLFAGGIASDMWGRKKSILVGMFFALLGAIIYAFSESFEMFLLAETAYGLSVSLASNNLPSFVYDSIKEKTASKKVFSHGSFYFLLGGIVAPFVAGTLSSFFGLRAPMIVNIIPLLVCFIIILRSKETKKAERTSTVLGHMKESISFVFRNRFLLFLTIIITVLSLFYYLNLYIIQPYLVSSGVSVFEIGLIFSGISLVSAILCRQSHMIEKRLGVKLTLIVATFLPMVGFLAISLFNPVLAVIGAVMVNSNKRFMEPVSIDYLNKMTKTKIRATVFSIVNLFYFVSYTIISPVVGYLSDAYGIHNVMIMLAITAVILAAFTIAGALRVGKKTIRILK
jgi:MFS family permease